MLLIWLLYDLKGLGTIRPLFVNERLASAVKVYETLNHHNSVPIFTKWTQRRLTKKCRANFESEVTGKREAPHFQQSHHGKECLCSMCTNAKHASVACIATMDHCSQTIPRSGNCLRVTARVATRGTHVHDVHGKQNSNSVARAPSSRLHELVQTEKRPETST